MAFITDEELKDYKEQIENIEEATRTKDYLHQKALDDAKENSQKLKITSIILGILAFLGIAGTIYFMIFNSPSNMISKKNHELAITERDVKIGELEEAVQNYTMNQGLDGSNPADGSLNDELIYAVQIGAYKNKDLSMYSDKFVNFKEIRSGEFNKYALGNFETLTEAKRFRKEIVKLGLKNSFIASYKNGKRLKIENAK